MMAKFLNPLPASFKDIVGRQTLNKEERRQGRGKGGQQSAVNTVGDKTSQESDTGDLH